MCPLARQRAASVKTKRKFKSKITYHQNSENQLRLKLCLIFKGDLVGRASRKSFCGYLRGHRGLLLLKLLVASQGG